MKNEPDYLLDELRKSSQHVNINTLIETDTSNNNPPSSIYQSLVLLINIPSAEEHLSPFFWISILNFDVTKMFKRLLFVAYHSAKCFQSQMDSIFSISQIYLIFFRFLLIKSAKTVYYVKSLVILNLLFINKSSAFKFQIKQNVLNGRDHHENVSDFIFSTFFRCTTSPPLASHQQTHT